MRVLLLCLSGMLVLLAGVSVRAQETTPDPFAPVESDLIETTIELIFPQQIIFSASTVLPGAQVADMELIIRTGSGQSDIVVSFPDDEDFAFANEFTVAIYEWNLTAETAPDLFSEVAYAWEVRGVNGESGATADTLVFRDPRAVWSGATPEDDDTDDFPVTVVIPETVIRESAADMRDDLEPTYRLMSERTGRTPDLNLLVYAEPDLPLGCNRDDEGNPVVNKIEGSTFVAIPCDVDLARDIMIGDGYEPVVVTDTENPDLVSAIMPRLLADFYDLEEDDESVPAWFQYGFRTLQNPVVNSSLVGIARRRLRFNPAFSLATMTLPPGDDIALPEWQAQSHGMVMYTARLAGVDAVFELAITRDDYDSFTEAYEAITGLTLSNLIPGWEQWVFTMTAAQDYRYSPFVGITPTPVPTFTRTPTPVPPTATDTPTVTPDYSPTPSPTRTPIPPTPTVTPRPAQGFNLRVTDTPAPVTASPQSPLETLSPAQMLVLAITGGLVLVTLIAALFASRRR